MLELTNLLSPVTLPWSWSCNLRTYARVGTVNGPTLSAQDMASDFSHTASFRLVADDPSAVSSASGKLTFNGVPEPAQAALEAVAALALALRGRTARRRRV